MKFFYAVLVITWFVYSRAYAQEIVFSQPIKKILNSTTQIVGKVKDHFIICEHLPNPSGRRLIRVFDQQMQQIGGEKIVPLPAGAMHADITAYPANLLLTYVEQKDGVFYYRALKLDEFAQPVGSPIVLDSFTDPLKRSGSWDLITSPNKQKLLISRIGYTRDSAFIFTKVFSSGLALLKQQEEKIYIAQPWEYLGAMHISNSGDIYVPVFHGTFGSMLKHFEVLSKPFGEHAFRSVLIQVREKILGMGGAIIKIEDNSNNNSSLLISAVCYSANVPHRVEGLFTARINAATNDVKAAISKINAPVPETMSSLDTDSEVELRKVFLMNNGGLMLVTTLDRSRSVTVSYPRSYLNMNVNSRFLYDPGVFRYPAGKPARMPDMYSIPGAYGPHSTTLPYNKHIMVYYLDSNLIKREQKIIVKNQADLKKLDAIYLDFGTVNASSAVHFLYREVKKRGGLIRNTSFSPNGEMLRLPPLRTVDDLYKLIPASAVQVAPRQVIVPGTYRGKTVYAKVDF